MNPPDFCPECGKPLPATSQHKLCPACLMAQAIASQTVEGNHGGDAPVPEPDEIAGKFPQFEILECLGRGGMGVVYKARQKSLNRLVAIKILAPEREHDARFAERFASEAELLAKLSHPHIVTIHDFGETGGLYYLVMEYVDGVNLRDLLRAGKLEPKQALAIVPEICDALQFAHDHGIIHRDIKPENILLDRLGRVKVADFGLAKLIGSRNEIGPETGGAGESPHLTEAGKIMGTPSYMAPEQTAHPDTVDHRADIYALGVVFYQMLTGELPGKNLEAPSRKVQIDVRLDEVVLRALEKNPDLRYSQASILKTQVETIAGTPAHQNAPPSGAGLLALGILSVLLGPLAAIPGLLLSRRFRPFTATAMVGYFLCWFSLVITVAVTILFLLLKPVQTPSSAMSSPIPATASVKTVSPVTATATRELEGDVGRLYHAIVYTQTSAEAPKPGPTSYQFIADMSNTQFPVTSSLVSLPAGSAWATNPVAVAKPDSLVGAHYLFAQGFKSEADLMANFPNGSYAFNVQSGGSGAAPYNAPVSFTGSVPYPPIAPVITNKTWDSGSLVLDPASAVINFTNYPGATLTWEIVIPGRRYIMSAGGGGTSLGSLNLTGLLSYGQTYEAQLRFINRDTSSTVSDPNSPKDYNYSTIVAQIVEFTIRTPPAHALEAPATLP